MVQTMTWVGLDVHARSVHAAVVESETGELRRARLGGGMDEVMRFLGTLRGPVQATYEAGPTGFWARARGDCCGSRDDRGRAQQDTSGGGGSCQD